MELDVAGGFDLGRRLFIIIFFLLALWYGLNLLVHKIKSGTWKIPKFLLDKMPALQQYSQGQAQELYKMEIVQRKQLADGSELMVLDVDGRHLLLSRHIQSGISYVADLNHR